MLLYFRLLQPWQEKARFSRSLAPPAERGMTCSTEKGSALKRSWLRQYSQQTPARSATRRARRVSPAQEAREPPGNPRVRTIVSMETRRRFANSATWAIRSALASSMRSDRAINSCCSGGVKVSAVRATQFVVERPDVVRQAGVDSLEDLGFTRGERRGVRLDAVAVGGRGIDRHRDLLPVRESRLVLQFDGSTSDDAFHGRMPPWVASADSVNCTGVGGRLALSRPTRFPSAPGPSEQAFETCSTGRARRRRRVMGRQADRSSSVRSGV